MPSYYVIGDDGNRYGPADVATLQQWIVEKRLTPETQLQDSESGDRMGAATVPGLNFSGSSSAVQSQGATGTMFQAGATAQENNPYSKTPGGSPYYRQGGGAQNYGEAGFPADKGIGITVIVLSSCGIMLYGLGVVGALAITAGMAAGNGAFRTRTGTMTGTALVAYVIIQLLLVLASLAIGIGILKSAKWGFVTGVIVYGLSVAANVVQFSPVGLVIGLCLLAYCGLRLSGTLGPKPV